RQNRRPYATATGKAGCRARWVMTDQETHAVLLASPFHHLRGAGLGSPWIGKAVETLQDDADLEEAV
ncbi:MAG TPA: hypothetical protein VFH20_10440, partial [Propionibacteriaceae bacterium]|nr:hypothetical protein [Propionibacteriaceae bacterium]